MELTGKQRRYLRGLGHGLAASVMVGKEGVSEAVADATREELVVHELIKVKLIGDHEVDRHQAAESLARMTDSAVAQVLGKTILLYRPRDEKPTLELP